MIKLTPSQTKTYEGIAAGLTVVQVAEQMKVNESTVRHHVKCLLRKQLIKQAGKKSHSKAYESCNLPFVTAIPEVPPRSKITREPVEDELLSKALNVKLSDEVVFYLKHNKKLKRSVLRKRTGLSRLELCFALERIG